MAYVPGAPDGSTRTGFLQRPRFLGLSEFGPHSLVYHEGRAYRVVAARLNTVVRQNDIVGRLGGDEFVVICETVDESSALFVAERITEAIRGTPGERAV
jgi:hypothetical protein